MTLFQLTWINVRRRLTRSLLGAAGIAFGVAAMLTVLSVVLGAIGMFDKILSNDSQYLVFEKNVSDLFFSNVATAHVEAITELPEVAEAHPILFGLVSSEGAPVITCFGLQPDDPRLAAAQWRAGSPEYFGTTPNRVYLGLRAAEFLDAHVGKTVPIGKESFEVGGILELSNGFENGGVFLPLADAQRFFHREGYSSIVAIKLADPDAGPAFEAAVASRFDDLLALKNEEFRQSYSQFKILTATAWAVGGCAFLLGGMGVANTMLMSVFTRTREIAILRVTGFSKKQIGAMILGESLLLATAGAAAGFALGYFGLLLLERAPRLQGYVQPHLAPVVVGGVIVVAFFTSLAGALYPAWRAARIQPSEALRYE